MNKDIFKGIPEIVASRFKKITDKFIQLLAKKLKEIKGVDKGDVHAYSVLLTDNSEIRKIKTEIASESRRTAKELQEVLDSVAENTIDDSMELIKDAGVDFQTYKKNSTMQLAVQGLSYEAIRTIQKLSNTSLLRIQNIDRNGNKSQLTLEEAYRSVISQAYRANSIGISDYDSLAMKLMQSISDSGIRFLDTETGNSQRIEVIAKNNTIEGMRTVYQGVQSEIGKVIDMDGVEISAHSTCAPDHLPYQGYQYSIKEFEEIQNSLKRQFGMWNCRHTWKSIILGVTKPTYTEEQLQAMRDYSNEIITFNGKQMTRYQATQYLNRLNSKITASKEKLSTAKLEGNSKLLYREQEKLTRYNQQIIQIKNAIANYNDTESAYIRIRYLNPSSYVLAKEVYKAEGKEGIEKLVDISIDNKGRKYIFEQGFAKTYRITPESLNIIIEAIPESLGKLIKYVEATSDYSPILTQSDIQAGLGVPMQAGKNKIFIWGYINEIKDSEFLGIFVHETGHLLDEELSRQYKTAVRFSKSMVWREIVLKDRELTPGWLTDQVELQYEKWKSFDVAMVEDFAESVRLFVLDKKKLMDKYPNRYSELEKWIK